MKLYKIPVMWQMYGYMDIEAETLDEARNEAYHFLRPLPEGNYVEDSFEVDEDVVEGMNHTKETETRDRGWTSGERIEGIQSLQADEDVVEGRNHTKEIETEGNVRKMVESGENDRGYE